MRAGRAPTGPTMGLSRLLPRRACDAETLEERSAAHLPFAVDPFSGQQEDERAPSWLDLFFDLAIAASLQVYAVNAASGMAQ